ncbi:hypothetical protein RI054_23g99320 [Pseudoscourfieldia marina]
MDDLTPRAALTASHPLHLHDHNAHGHVRTPQFDGVGQVCGGGQPAGGAGVRASGHDKSVNASATARNYAGASAQGAHALRESGTTNATVHASPNAGIASLEEWAKHINADNAKSLTSLDISHNAIRDVGQLARYCPRIEDLRIGNNALHHDPVNNAVCGLHTLQALARTLRTLSLRGNAIASDDTGAPAQSPYLFASMRALVSLDLARCALRALPNVSGCVSLQKLDVSGNAQLGSLADAPTRLPRNIRALRLHATSVRSVLQLKYLTPFVQLRELTLAKTPLANLTTQMWRVDHRSTALALIPRLVSLDGENCRASCAWVSCARGVFRNSRGGWDERALSLLAEDREDELMEYLSVCCPLISYEGDVRYAEEELTTSTELLFPGNSVDVGRAMPPTQPPAPPSAPQPVQEEPVREGRMTNAISQAAFDAVMARAERAEAAAASAERRAAAAESAARAASAAVEELREEVKRLAATVPPSFDLFNTASINHAQDVSEESAEDDEQRHRTDMLPISPVTVIDEDQLEEEDEEEDTMYSEQRSISLMATRATDLTAMTPGVTQDLSQLSDAGTTPTWLATAVKEQGQGVSSSKNLETPAATMTTSQLSDVGTTPTWLATAVKEQGQVVSSSKNLETPAATMTTSQLSDAGTTPTWLATAVKEEGSFGSVIADNAPEETTPSWLAAADDEVKVMPPSRLASEVSRTPTWLNNAVDDLGNDDVTPSVTGGAGGRVDKDADLVQPPTNVKRLAMQAARAAVR